MAAAEIAHYRWLADRITALDVLPDDAMAPYVEALQAYHDSTEPKDWLEAVTLHVGAAAGGGGALPGRPGRRRGPGRAHRADRRRGGHGRASRGDAGPGVSGR
jgi:hypothetical protein